MIKVNERFSFERDKYQWLLHDSHMGKPNKEGVSNLQTKTSYHGSLDQVASQIIERECGECQSMTELLTLLNQTKSVCAGYLVGKSE